MEQELCGVIEGAEERKGEGEEEEKKEVGDTRRRRKKGRE